MKLVDHLSIQALLKMMIFAMTLLQLRCTPSPYTTVCLSRAPEGAKEMASHYILI